MKINYIERTAIVEKNIEFTNTDAIALGCASEFIHKLVENRKAHQAYDALPYDSSIRKEKGSRPEVINVHDKHNWNTLMNELTMLDKFISKIAIRPSDSNIFSDEED